MYIPQSPLPEQPGTDAKSPLLKHSNPEAHSVSESQSPSQILHGLFSLQLPPSPLTSINGKSGESVGSIQ